MNTTSTPTTALQQVLGSKLFLGATIALFLSGLGTSAAAPQIVTFLVKELGASLSLAGLYYLTSLGAPIAGYLVGRYSDRSGIRLGLFRLCALAGFIGWAGIAMASDIWTPFVISLLVLGFAGAATSQLFTAVHDELGPQAGPAGDGVVAIVRMALTAGWIIGPVLGAWVAAVHGLRPMMWMTAVFTLLQIVPLGTLRSRAAPHPGDAGPKAARSPSLRQMGPLLLFTGLFVLVYAGEPIKYGFLLIHMEDQLHLSPAVRGAVIGLQPFVELLIMPLCVPLGRRLGNLRLMALAALLGVAANLCFAGWPAATGMFAGQVLMGGVWGVFMVLGILVAQRLLPDAVATASAIFMSAPALSSALGGAAGGLGVAALGLPQVFLLPAGFAALAAAGLAWMSRRGLDRG